MFEALILCCLERGLDPPGWLYQVPCFQAACQRVLCQELELLDPERTCWTQEKGPAAFQEARGKRSFLAGCPHTWEAQRFPHTLTLLRAWEDLAGQQAEHAESMATGWPLERDCWGQLAREARRRASLYETLRETKAGYYDLATRRASLARLRDSLCSEDWQAGILPPPCFWVSLEVQR